MAAIKILKVDQLFIPAIIHLVESSQIEGFRHLSRLVTEYESGVNTFSQEGEALFVAQDNDLLIGICGLNQDISNRKGIGRIRRLYVQPEYRKNGIGKDLVKEVIKTAKPYFQRLVLKTDHEKSFEFYNALGFKESKGIINESHYIDLY